jgi:hypothetical protein
MTQIVKFGFWDEKWWWKVDPQRTFHSDFLLFIYFPNVLLSPVLLCSWPIWHAQKTLFYATGAVFYLEVSQVNAGFKWISSEQALTTLFLWSPCLLIVLWSRCHDMMVMWLFVYHLKSDDCDSNRLLTRDELKINKTKIWRFKKKLDKGYF